MSAFPEPDRTTTAFLSSLHDLEDRAAWVQFEQRYAPGIRAIARRLGLAGAEIEDALQETLLQFVRDYGKGGYDRSRGRLTSWVMGIARHRVLDLLRSRSRRERTAGVLEDEPCVDEFEARWEEEERRFILNEALENLQRNTRMGERTLEAFRLVVFEGIAPDQVAKRLGMTRSHVYVAKHDCLGQIRSWLEGAPS